MRVLFVGLARSIWLFDLSLLNPKGVNLQGPLDKLKEKYQFAKAPKNVLDLDESQALAFKAGTFVNSKGVPLVVSLSIYQDGFVADTLSSTDDSTEFLVNMTDWVQKECNLVLPTDVKKGYLGQIHFECDVPLVALNSRLTQALRFIEENCKPFDGNHRKFDVAGLSFWTEDVNQPRAPAVLKFERKMGAPFASNYYFSQAPLETRPHIELLNELEQILRT
jgi:hypothetical protein